MTNEDIIAGTIGEGVGKAEHFAGDALNAPELKAGGIGREWGGKAQATVGAAKEKFGAVAEQARTAATKASAQAKDAAAKAKIQAKDAAAKAEAQAREAYGKVSDQAKDAYGKASVKAKDVYGKAQIQAKDAYGKASEQVKTAADKIDPLIKEKPYAALGIAAAAGVLAGIILASMGSKTVYVSKD